MDATLAAQCARFAADAVHEYRGPVAVRGVVAEAGCGAGLCGDIFATLGEALVGVEPSPGLAAAAKGRLCGGRPAYSDVANAELAPFFRDRAGAFDLVVSPTALALCGSLDEVLAAIAGSLRADGLVAFTLAYAQEDSAVHGFLCGDDGTFLHTETYTRGALKQAGLAAKLVNPVAVATPEGPAHRLLVLAKKRR